jgi:hypothetical protein
MFPSIIFSQKKGDWKIDTTYISSDSLKIRHHRYNVYKGARQLEQKVYIYNKCNQKVYFEHTKIRMTIRVIYDKHKVKKYKAKQCK